MPPLWWLLLLDQENNEVNQKWIYQKSQFSFKIEEGLHGLKGNWIISTPNYKDKLLKSIVWHSSRNAGDPSPIRFKFVNNSQNHFHPVWLDDECIMYIFHLTLNYFLNFNSSMCQYSAQCKKTKMCACWKWNFVHQPLARRAVCWLSLFVILFKRGSLLHREVKILNKVLIELLN